LAFEVSLFLLLMQLIVMAAVNRLNSQIKESQSRLIRNYRLGWKLAMACAFIQVLLLIPLLGYASYELPVIWANTWYPQLLLGVAVLGIAIILGLAAVLFAKVPLRFNEPMSRRVSPAEAPELWAAVRTAASRLGTNPPDNIIIGLQLNFYVTELAVTNGKDTATGRTLFLSYPMLKQLPEEEVIAIIGHELGHFIGEDTRLTREFFPLHLKTNGTLQALNGAKQLGWSTFHFLNFFAWSFGETQRTVSRRRELLADSKAAAVTSSRTAANALVRFHVLIEAFNQGLVEAVKKGGQSPLDIPLHTVVRQKLPAGVPFWNELFEKKLPHPLDSHPALQVRLEALGQTIDAKAAEALAIQDNPTAYDRWFANRNELFFELHRLADNALRTMSSRAKIGSADYQTPEGRKLLDELFPVKKWQRNNLGLAVLTIVLSAVASGCLIGAVVLGNDYLPMKLFFGCAALLAVGTCFIHWVRHNSAIFTLSAEGVHYTGWNRPLRFPEVEKISFFRKNSDVTVTFHLKEPQLPFWKVTLLGYRRKTLRYSLYASTNMKQADIAQILFRYFTRQTKP
jgi:Zn-dependent protease with chaperone function